MGHKSREQQRRERERRNNRVDHQVSQKGKSPKVYRRTKVEIDKYIERLNEDWTNGIDA